jgi:hypothetical protein
MVRGIARWILHRTFLRSNSYAFIVWLLLKRNATSRPVRLLRAGRYGPEVPDTDDRTHTLIAMLHYEIPCAKDLPPGTVYGALERFLHELNRGTDARHAAARRLFIARVRSVARPSIWNAVALFVTLRWTLQLRKRTSEPPGL